LQAYRVVGLREDMGYSEMSLKGRPFEKIALFAKKRFHRCSEASDGRMVGWKESSHWLL